MPNPVVLFTGVPGVGKSTAVSRVISALPSGSARGMLTNEIRVDGRRQGFQIELVGASGSGPLALPGLKSPYRFGSEGEDGLPRLGVTLEFLEDVALPYVQAANASISVVDEIGPMQASSSEFRNYVDQLIKGTSPVVGSLGLNDHPWLNELRSDKDVCVIELTRGNRDTVAAAVALFMAASLGGDV